MTLLDADKHDGINAVGEDTFELFESIEKSFDVNLGDFESLAGVRVAELAENICRLASYPPKEKCLPAVAFYKLRHALAELSDISSKSIRPATPVKKLLPWRSRKARWSAIQERLDLKLPQLVLPGWLLLLCITIPTMLLLLAKFSIGLDINWGELVGFSLILACCSIYACAPLARSLPHGCETFGDFAKTILAQNYAVFAKRHTGSTNEDVLSSLRLLIASEIGTEVSKILPETRIPADLNIY